MLCAFIALATLDFSTLDTSKLSIEFNGVKSGESVYTRNPDGTFSGSMNLAIASIKISASIDGKFEGDKLVRYSAKSAQPQGSADIVFEGTKIKVTSAGKSQDIPYDFEKSGASFAASLIPNMFDRAVKRVKFEIGKAQTLPVFLADIGSQIPIKFTPKARRALKSGIVLTYDLSINSLQSVLAADENGHILGFDVPAQKLRWIADGWSDLFSDPMAKYTELSPSTFGVTRLEKQTMRTRDGVELVQDVLLPDKPGKYPTILMRTPYGRASDAATSQWFVARGYAVVAQDCRGRGDSSGTWDPFVFERKDGYDAVEWIAQQPWSDGSVGMIGGSYGGYVQWAAAVERPPALKCIVPQVSPPDAMRNLPYEYGVPFLLGGLWWLRIVESKNADMSQVSKPIAKPEKFLTLPISKVDDELLGHDVKLWNVWVDRAKKSDWKGWDYTDDIANVAIPALHVSGWWDGDGIGTKLNWAALRAAGKKNQWLIYGPWVHAFNTNSKFGDQDYGKQAIIELDAIILRYFDTYLKHKSVGWDKQPKVMAFATGTNEWKRLSDWPDQGVSSTERLYFSAPNGALAPAKMGTLVAKPVAKAKPVSYVYDPAKEKVDRKEVQVGSGEATTIVKINPVNPTVVFQTTPMKATTTIGGPITLHVNFSTTAHDTDLFAGVLDIDEKGTMRMIGMPGKVRGSYIRDMSNPAPLTSNKVYEATVRPWDTMHSIKPGHRFAIFICSSLFPSYARNLGYGEPPATATKMMAQRNTIFLDKTHPSYVEFQRFQR